MQHSYSIISGETFSFSGQKSSFGQTEAIQVVITLPLALSQPSLNAKNLSKLIHMYLMTNADWLGNNTTWGNTNATLRYNICINNNKNLVSI